MNLEQFDVNDFLTDDSFYQSVVDPNGEEALFWKTWLNDHPEKMEQAKQAKKVLSSIDFKDRSFSQTEITQLWKNIKEETGNAHSLETPAKAKAIWPYRFLKVAAVIVPFLIASVLFLFFRDIQEAPQTLAPEIIEKYNPNGQKLTVFFSDGSKVKLNGDTRISYSKPFNEQQRVVHLEGEAFFEVAPDKSRPFVVKSGNLETKVLGTSFNVLAYPADDNIIVAVRSGKVAVKELKQKVQSEQYSSILLSPAEMAVYSKKEHLTEVSEFDPVKTFGWSEGILHLDNACIEEFEKKLERWYGVDIIIKRDKPIAKGITGKFEDQSLEQILMGTMGTSDFEYEFLTNGNVVIK